MLSRICRSLWTSFISSANTKKRKYNDRIVNIERVSFTPLIFSTTGGMSKECEKLNQCWAERISLKKDRSTDVISDILFSSMYFFYTVNLTM